VVDFLGQAAFSRAVQALDIKTGNLVCLKIIKARAPVCVLIRARVCVCGGGGALFFCIFVILFPIPRSGAYTTLPCFLISHILC
jgi:hypothetical protein